MFETRSVTHACIRRTYKAGKLRIDTTADATGQAWVTGTEYTSATGGTLPWIDANNYDLSSFCFELTPALNTRYLRVYVEYDTSNTYGKIDEIRLKDDSCTPPTAPSLQAIGCSTIDEYSITCVQESSKYTNSERGIDKDCGLSIDGDMTTSWQTAEGSVNDQFLSFDLGGVKSVNFICLVWGVTVSSEYGSYPLGADSVRIDTSSDGSTLSPGKKYSIDDGMPLPYVDQTGNATDLQCFSIEEISTQYVRLFFDRAFLSKQIGVTEVELVKASDCSANPPTPPPSDPPTTSSTVVIVVPVVLMVVLLCFILVFIYMKKRKDDYKVTPLKMISVLEEEQRFEQESLKTLETLVAEKSDKVVLLRQSIIEVETFVLSPERIKVMMNISFIYVLCSHESLCVSYFIRGSFSKTYFFCTTFPKIVQEAYEYLAALYVESASACVKEQDTKRVEEEVIKVLRLKISTTLPTTIFSSVLVSIPPQHHLNYNKLCEQVISEANLCIRTLLYDTYKFEESILHAEKCLEEVNRSQLNARVHFRSEGVLGFS